jgi:hypothetical protein
MLGSAPELGRLQASWLDEEPAAYECECTKRAAVSLHTVDKEVTRWIMNDSI